MRNHIVLPRCTVQLATGEFCDADAAEDMPFPICERHALQLHQRMQQDPARVWGIPCPECDRKSLQRLGVDVTCRACNATISPDRFRLWSDTVTEEALSNATKARQ